MTNHIGHSYQHTYEPFPKQKILDSSRLKEFANDRVKFDENGDVVSKGAENTAGKGEIARHKQFLLLTKSPKNKGFFWERVNFLPHNPNL